MLRFISLVSNTCHNSFTGRISIMRCFSIRIALVHHFFHSAIQTAQIIHIILGKNLNSIFCLTIMCINGIKFQCPVYIIMTTATNGHHFFQVRIILENSHQTCLLSFYCCLIDHISIRNSILGCRNLCISQHNGKRTLVRNGLINPFTGQITPCHSFRNCRYLRLTYRHFLRCRYGCFLCRI